MNDETYKLQVMEKRAELKRAEANAADCRVKAEATKARLKAAEKEVDEARRELYDVIDGRTVQCSLPLESAGARPVEVAHGDSAARAAVANPAGAGDDGWRETPIGKLENFGLSPALTEKLHEAELTTIGALANFTAADNRLIDIDGIGQAKAEKIEKALEGFWADWHAKHPAPVDVAGSETVDEDGTEQCEDEEVEIETDVEVDIELDPEESESEAA